MSITTGRIVRYVPQAEPGVIPAQEPFAAMVVKVWTASLPPAGNGCCNLTVFLPAGGIEARTSVCYDEAMAPGTWHWPPRASE